VAVYFYTRTGTSEKVAKEIDLNALKITDDKNWSGAWGFVKASFSALMKKSVPVKYQKPKNSEEIILVMPLWAEGMPPAVRTFINEVGREKIKLVVTSKGSKLRDRAGFIKVVDLVGENLSGEGLEI